MAHWDGEGGCSLMRMHPLKDTGKRVNREKEEEKKQSKPQKPRDSEWAVVNGGDDGHANDDEDA